MSRSKFTEGVLSFVKKYLPDREHIKIVSIEGRAGNEWNTLNVESQSHGVDKEFLDTRASDTDILELLKTIGCKTDHVKYAHIVVNQTETPIVTVQYMVAE